MDSIELKKYHKQYSQELFENCLPFWLNYSIDDVNGGIYSCLDRVGQIYSTDKSVWLNGRSAWTFSHLCNQYGIRAEWHDVAESCLNFLNDYCIDRSDGRMYFSVTKDGKPLRKRRYFFSECFYIIANAEYALAFNDENALYAARKYYDFILSIYRDPSCDPYKITPKNLLYTRDCKTFSNVMILLNVTNTVKRCDPLNSMKYERISQELIDEMLNGFYNEEYGVFLENISSDGQLFDNCSTARLVNPGHGIEGAWFILSEAIDLNNHQLVEAAANIFKSTLSMGWDKEYGGLYYFRDLLGWPPEQCENNMKLWWPHTEAIIACIMLYEATGDDYFFKEFKKLTDYAFSSFSDPEYGEWYGYLSRNGEPVLPASKGSLFKGPFHLPRMLITVERSLDRLIKKTESVNYALQPVGEVHS